MKTIEHQLNNNQLNSTEKNFIQKIRYIYKKNHEALSRMETGSTFPLLLTSVENLKDNLNPLLIKKPTDETLQKVCNEIERVTSNESYIYKVANHESFCQTNCTSLFNTNFLMDGNNVAQANFSEKRAGKSWWIKR
jgi:hypothetical protein